METQKLTTFAEAKNELMELGGDQFCSMSFTVNRFSTEDNVECCFYTEMQGHVRGLTWDEVICKYRNKVFPLVAIEIQAMMPMCVGVEA